MPAGRQLPFWLLAAAYGAAFLLPVLVAEGTFVDGEIYAVLARNYAEGHGTLWQPHLSASVHPSWHEHPPAGLWLMSLTYRVLGDGIHVEHVHSLLTALVAGWLVVRLWRRLLPDAPGLARLGWLPLLMWLMNPQVTWAYSNAMLENTSTIWVLLALLALVGPLSRPGGGWGRAALGGAAIVAAVLTKGPVGLFALAAVPLHGLIVGRPGPRRTVLLTLVPLAVVALAGLALWSWPAARLGIERYLDQQLLANFAGRRGGDRDVLGFLANLRDTHLPALGLGLVLAGLAWWRGGRASLAGGRVRTALWLLALGLAGSVPLAVSPRRSLFYVLPSFPCLALGLALFVAPAARSLVDRLRPGGRALRGWLLVAGVLWLGVAGFAATRVGTYARDGVLRADVKRITAHVLDGRDRAAARDVTLALCDDLRRNWALHTAFNRYGRLNVDLYRGEHPWRVARDGCEAPPLEGWERVDLGTREYHLWVRGPEPGVSAAPR